MAITFPLTFDNTLFQRQKPLRLIHAQETSQSKRGQIFVKDLGSPLWGGEWTTKPLRNAVALELEAKLALLDGTMNTFLLGDMRRLSPEANPTVDDSLCAIYALNANNKALQLDGLAAGTVLTAGDYFAFEWGAGSSVAFHQVMETVTADGSGITPEFEVRPHIRAGAAINDPVTLVNARAEWILVPESLTKEEAGPMHTVISWQAIQNALRDA